MRHSYCIAERLLFLNPVFIQKMAHDLELMLSDAQIGL